MKNKYKAVVEWKTKNDSKSLTLHHLGIDWNQNYTIKLFLFVVRIVFVKAVKIQRLSSVSSKDLQWLIFAFVHNGWLT